MMYSLDISPELDKKLRKLSRKHPRRARMILKKAEEILQNPLRYKNLRAPMKHWKRVHVDSSFILLFSVDEETKTVLLKDYNHHDKIYK